MAELLDHSPCVFRNGFRRRINTQTPSRKPETKH